MNDDDLKRDLANAIADELRKEFEYIHLTKQLYNSIKVIPTERGYMVEINPQAYDVNWYRKHQVIRPPKDPSRAGGSYANTVNKTGGLSKTHKDYVHECIYAGIQKWMARNNLNIKCKGMNNE